MKSKLAGFEGESELQALKRPVNSTTPRRGKGGAGPANYIPTARHCVLLVASLPILNSCPIVS